MTQQEYEELIRLAAENLRNTPEYANQAELVLKDPNLQKQIESNLQESMRAFRDVTPAQIAYITSYNVLNPNATSKDASNAAADIVANTNQTNNYNAQLGDSNGLGTMKMLRYMSMDSPEMEKFLQLVNSSLLKQNNPSLSQDNDEQQRNDNWPPRPNPLKTKPY